MMLRRAEKLTWSLQIKYSYDQRHKIVIQNLISRIYV